MLSELLLKVLNFLTPSTQTSIRAMVPVTVAADCTVTGEATVEPLAGEHTFTPGEPGAAQLEPPMVYDAEPTALCAKPGAMATACRNSEVETWMGPV